MKIHRETIEFRTGGHGTVTLLDDRLQAIVERSGVRRGMAHLFNVGSTGALTTLEYEPGLKGDLQRTLDRLIPPGREYAHEAAWADGNAHSHLQASITGPDLTVPVEEGRLLLGTWQQVVHVECDVRPRRRKVVVTVWGEEG